MQFTPWKTLSSKVLIKYRKWDYVEDEVELPNGRHSTYQYIKGQGAAIIIPVDAGGKITVMKQYRYLLNDESLEFPAGMIEGGLTALETAHKELAEEAGLKAENMEYLGKCLVATGSVQAFNHYYLATGITKTEMDLEDTEQINVSTMTPQEFDDCIVRGEVIAGHILSGWALARSKILAN